jgi:hypothetical protein
MSTTTAQDLTTTWTDCPHCHAHGSVAPFGRVPALMHGLDDEEMLYDEHLSSMCLACHAIVGA